MVVRRKRILHLGTALVMRRVLRGRLRQVDDLVVLRGPARRARGRGDALHALVTNARRVQRRADMLFVRRRVEVHRHLRSAAEVNSQRNVVPERHAQNAGDRKQERKGQEVPLPSQPVDLYLAKQFHVSLYPLAAKPQRAATKSLIPVP